MSDAFETRPALRRLGCIVLASLLLTWPAIVNGGVFFTTDSIGYIRGPDQAISRLLGPGHATLWSATPMGLGFSAGRAGEAPREAAKSPPMAGRSIYYGLLANLGARTGGFWLTILVQALAVALSLDLLCRSLGFTRARTFLGVALAAAFLTPLAFFADCIMPDVWAPVLLLTTAALAAGGERLGLGERLYAAAMLCYAASVHTTHPLLLLTTGAVALAILVFRRRSGPAIGAPGLAAALAGIAVAVGLLAGAAFDVAVTRAYGEPAVRPPFLTARLVGDGRPGERWLRRHCGASRFEVCRFVSRLPMSTDSFLWSGDPAKSVFWTASPEERRALGREQFGFALAVAADDPLGVARQVLADGLGQFADMSMFEFNHKENVRANMTAWMVDPDAQAWKRSMAWRRAWPTGLMDQIQFIAFSAGAAGLLALALTRLSAGAGGLRERVLVAGAVVSAALLANALVCGGLADIFGRYQARLSGPLILVGLFAWSALVQRRAAGSAAPVIEPEAAPLQP
jgi:hypothetical protein